MEPALAIVVRLAFGLVFGLFLSLAGFFAGWFIAPPGQTIPTGLLLSASGVGGGIGGFIGWLKPEGPPGVIATHLGLVMAGGAAGAWGGWDLGHVLYPEGVYNPGSSFNTPPFIVAMLGASIGGNMLGSVFYIFRMWRFRET